MCDTLNPPPLDVPRVPVRRYVRRVRRAVLGFEMCSHPLGPGTLAHGRGADGGSFPAGRYTDRLKNAQNFAYIESRPR